MDMTEDENGLGRSSAMEQDEIGKGVGGVGVALEWVQPKNGAVIPCCTAAVSLKGRNSQKSARHLIYYGVATISRLLKVVGVFCKRAL